MAIKNKVEKVLQWQIKAIEEEKEELVKTFRDRANIYESEKAALMELYYKCYLQKVTLDEVLKQKEKLEELENELKRFIPQYEKSLKTIESPLKLLRKSLNKISINKQQLNNL